MIRVTYSCGLYDHARSLARTCIVDSPHHHHRLSPPHPGWDFFSRQFSSSMQRFILRYGTIHECTASLVKERLTAHRFFALNVLRPLATVERKERLKVASNILASNAATQPKTDDRLESEPRISIVETPSVTKVGDFLEAEEAITGMRVDKSAAIPFDEIPGPTVLKIWEKYWKYVPLFGTQVFRSLLINKFTLGRLNWNRNIRPMKYLFNEYGPIVRIHGPMLGDIVMIHRPEHVAEIYKQEGDAPIRSGIDVLQHYRSNYKKSRLSGAFTMSVSPNTFHSPVNEAKINIINTNGTEWTEMRSRLEKPLSEQVTRYFNQIEVTCDEVGHRIRKIRSRQDEVPGNFHQDLSRWAMECFSILMLNKRMGFLEPAGFNATSEPTKVIEAMEVAQLYLSRCESGFQFWRFFQTPFVTKLFGACDVIDSVIGKYIRQAQMKMRNRGMTNSNDDSAATVLEQLLSSQEMTSDDASTLLMDMIILGVQATANSEAFLLYYLAKNPRVQRRVYEEVTSVMPKIGSTMSQYHLKKMPYLRACLKECLRLRPAFPYVTRVLPKSVNMHGYSIPKGTYVIMANEISSRREENFEDPEKFRPERWLDANAESYGHQEFSCLPFGHGIRSCLGREMAETQMMLLTAKLIRDFKIEYDYADISSRHFMINIPNRPLRFRFVDRD